MRKQVNPLIINGGTLLPSESISVNPGGTGMGLLVSIGNY